MATNFTNYTNSCCLIISLIANADSEPGINNQSFQKGSKKFKIVQVINALSSPFDITKKAKVSLRFLINDFY